MIICSFFSRFCTLSSSSHCTAKASWVSLEIAALSSGGIEMAITDYHSWREQIYHLLRTDLLQSIFDLFLSVSFEKLSSWCCKNAAMIASLLVAGEQLFRYWTVSLTSYMVGNVNVNINNDLCFTLSCELFGWPTIVRSQALEIVYCAHSGDVEGVVGKGESVSWGGARTKGEVHKRKLTNKIFLHSDFLKSLSSSLTLLF